MISGFAHRWTPIAPAASVGKAPTRHVIAGEPLVVWRDAMGAAVVLLDRCPHRSVSLSLGRRTAGGTLACAFHGWEFGAGGSCEHVPFHPDAPRHRLGATAIPSREAHASTTHRAGPGAHAVVESSDPVEVPPGAEERSVRTDRPTLTFRTWYHRHLRDSDA